MDIAVLCDFDGTVTEKDTTVTVFNKFVDGDWRIFNERLDRGEITLEQCIREQFSMIKAPRSAILREAELDIPFRPGFEELVNYCNDNRVPVEIVSAGLDFVVNHLLQARGLGGMARVCAARTRFTGDGIEIDPMELHDEESVDFKRDLVDHYKSRKYFVFYVGDGMSDKGAVGSADYVFTIKGSRLTEFCRNEGIEHQEIGDFKEVTAKIREMKG
jgi:2-hydroxy-3-keto-5-methylthiopentenyl-1-phosphate phosphatase